MDPRLRETYVVGSVERGHTYPRHWHLNDGFRRWRTSIHSAFSQSGNCTMLNQ
jgi:hypothetical protein